MSHRKGENMRLNTKKLQEIMREKDLTEEIICTRTGLDRSSLGWILENGYASEEAMERIARVTGIEIKAIYLPDITACIENTI